MVFHILRLVKAACVWYKRMFQSNLAHSLILGYAFSNSGAPQLGIAIILDTGGKIR